MPGFILPFVLSSRLHAGRLTDAYFLSFAVATFVASVLSNVLEVSVIPAVAAHSRAGAAMLRTFLVRTVRVAMAVAIAAYIPTALIGVAIVDARRGWSASEKHLCIVLILVFGLYILATALTSVLDGSLFALGQFFLPTVSQCMRTLLPLACILVTGRDAAGVIAVASLLVVGELLRGLLLSYVLARKLRGLPAESSTPQRSRFFEASIPLAMSLVVVAASPLIDKIVASPLGVGSVTLVELAEKVFFVPVLALTSSVVLVAGSRWARLSLERPDALSGDFSRTFRTVVGLATLAALAIGILVSVASLVNGPRMLGLDASRFRTLVLLFLAGLPPAIIIAQGARLMTALQRTRLLPLFAVSAFSVNLIGDIAGAHLLGVNGIALASTLFRYVNAALYVWTCRLILRTVSTGWTRTVPFLLR